MRTHTFGRALVALLFLGAGVRGAGAQTANRWLVLAVTEPTIELDTTTLSKSEGFPRVWLRITYTTPQGKTDQKYISMKWRVDFDCAKRRDNIVTAINYAENGDVVSSVTEPRPQWFEPVPETVVESALDAFCKTPFARR